VENNLRGFATGAPSLFDFGYSTLTKWCWGKNDHCTVYWAGHHAYPALVGLAIGVGLRLGGRWRWPAWLGALIALSLAGAAAVMVVAPPRVHAQSLWAEIQAVIDAITGIIQTGLNSINAARTAISKSYQNVIWPVGQINQATARVTQMPAQFQNPMRGIFGTNLASATLPAVQQLEGVMRNHQIGDFNTLVTNYTNAYGPVPSAAAASPADRAMTDMDDALTLDNLKTLKATDDTADLTLQAADQLESGASQSAPGSAPMLGPSRVRDKCGGD